MVKYICEVKLLCKYIELFDVIKIILWFKESESNYYGEGNVFFMFKDNVLFKYVIIF